MGNGQELYKKAKGLIPGGTQLFSKRPEIFLPDLWPSYYSKAKGVHIWDMDGTSYLDMATMGIGVSILGYADNDVDRAVIEAIRNGIATTLNCPEEVELAELLIKLHPWAEMVRYTRSGGEAMAVAVRISRAKTGRDIVVFSGYHGWHDWYLAANLADQKNLDGQLMPGLSPLGVPRGLLGSAIPFFFNDIERFEEIVKTMKDKIAAVIVEPARCEDASREFLERLRKTTTEIGAVFVFDEITSGFRMNPGGIHMRYEIYPDIAVFAKGIANGYPMAAILGKAGVMGSAQDTFISSTNWTERVGPVAALATIRKYIKNNVHEHIIMIGNRIKEIWSKIAEYNGLPIKITGIATIPTFVFEHPYNKIMQTIFVQEMLKKGIIAFRQVKPSWAHQSSHLKQYEDALYEVFPIIAGGLRRNNLPSLLETAPAHDGFFRLTKE